ncbi:adenosylcobinamide-GDP ribazoletransferase [Paracoccus sp. MBLB3053]|uniref:Adenosylcobinamide-GDP ribazoletransferase n=1 Tax=Paracoccus aurantius TaxID=3073814 RepID=A0ABU2HTD9_9RHOB|nr:adenosylcobinamide-GDP ribazoletransferase [Paracoccus sp. MBLB3053]MDS9468002.1 adenosylcobinamide-GDP ribazoletransferase [Paracoccus sp. MBLB3053]
MARLPGEAATALVWLTRLPLGAALPRPIPSLALAAWAFPLAGLVVASCAGLVLIAAAAIGLPSPVVAILAIGTMVWLTGGIHEDGLADFADGCGGATRERSLEIMRDSRIGSYGVIALMMVIGLRVGAVSALVEDGSVSAAAALIGAAAFSRSGMAVALAKMPAARRDGLGREAGQVPVARAAVAVILGFGALALAALTAKGGIAIVLLAPLACAAAQLFLARMALRRLGGQTGDVLGAIQQAGEAACLLAFLTWR